MHLVSVFFNQLSRQTVLRVNDASDFVVHFFHGRLAHVGSFGDRTAQENLAFILAAS